MTKRQQRDIVEQYTNAELRQRVHDERGFGLLTPTQARQWKTMAYGVLLERWRQRKDRELTVVETRIRGYR
jgi:hypothetical protein